MSDSFSDVMDRAITSWRKVWKEDCIKKGRIMPFGKWCGVALIEGDPDSSPFEIANVYTEDTFR